MYLAQGGGIIIFALTRRPVPGAIRLVLGIMLIMAFFSPGINIFILGALVLLGVAVNWLPLRVIKPAGSV
jgi:hypothetical protein